MKPQAAHISSSLCQVHRSKRRVDSAAKRSATSTQLATRPADETKSAPTASVAESQVSRLWQKSSRPKISASGLADLCPIEVVFSLS